MLTIQSHPVKAASIPKCNGRRKNKSVGHFREDLLDRRYRFWPVGSYLIVYRW